MLGQRRTLRERSRRRLTQHRQRRCRRPQPARWLPAPCGRCCCCCFRGRRCERRCWRWVLRAQALQAGALRCMATPCPCGFQLTAPKQQPAEEVAAADISTGGGGGGGGVGRRQQAAGAENVTHATQASALGCTQPCWLNGGRAARCCIGSLLAGQAEGLCNITHLEPAQVPQASQTICNRLLHATRVARAEKEEARNVL